MDTPNTFNRDWSIREMVVFMGHVIDEKVVVCEWMDNGTRCNDRVKGKDLKVHVNHKHGVTSDVPLYQCRWHACTSQPMKKSSLERHMKEQHIPVKWACPSCTRTFTRECNLVGHVQDHHPNA